MPTLLRQSGFEFVIRTRDHEPPHVHVFYGRTEVLLFIGLNGNPPSLREVRGMNRQNARRALEIMAERNDEFLRSWREIHG